MTTDTRPHPAAGFTLIETLVSLAIVAFIGVAAYLLLGSAARLERHGNDALETLAAMQSALRLLESDLSRIVMPGSPEAHADPHAFVVSSDAGTQRIELTRTGRAHALDGSAGQLRRVGWSVDDDGRLWRSDSALTTDPQSAPRARVVCANLAAFDVEFLDSRKAWQRDWPPAPPTDTGRGETLEDRLPRALRLRLVHPTAGELVRVLPIR